MLNMSIKIFAMNISERLNQPVDDWLKYFSLEHREKILSYLLNTDKNRTVWTELLTRHVVAEKFSYPIEKIRVCRAATGSRISPNFLLK